MNSLNLLFVHSDLCCVYSKVSQLFPSSNTQSEFSRIKRTLLQRYLHLNFLYLISSLLFMNWSLKIVPVNYHVLSPQQAPSPGWMLHFVTVFIPGLWWVDTKYWINIQHITSHPALEDAMAENNAWKERKNFLRNHPQFAISFVDKKRLSYFQFLYSFQAWSWNMLVLISCHHGLGSRGRGILMRPTLQSVEI